jgi:hypothetical protein|tara:strand:- start:223 stop:558 length:336 start_codon:yes stop_codon:yes gene_type:complete
MGFQLRMSNKQKAHVKATKGTGLLMGGGFGPMSSKTTAAMFKTNKSMRNLGTAGAGRTLLDRLATNLGNKILLGKEKFKKTSGVSGAVSKKLLKESIKTRTTVKPFKPTPN